MTALIRAELLQLRTLRSTYAAVLGLIALIALVTVASLADAKDLVTPDEVRAPVVAGAGILSAFFLALLGAMRVAGEYRHATIAQRALAEPRRARLIAAKLITYGSVGSVVATVVFAISVAIALPMVASKDLSMALTAADVLELGSHVALAGTLFALLGVAVGFLSRSQPAAVVAVFGTFIAEKIVGGFIGDAAGYLPFGLLDGMLDKAAPISPGVAALVLTAIAAALSALAATRLTRRDVTA
jgi:ABC-2 type transport system permease protein